MKQEPEFFADRPMVLVYIAKKLKEALAVEEKLTAAGFEYAVETDTYLGGVIFRGERTGAFFYVEDADQARAIEALRAAGYKPVVVE